MARPTWQLLTERLKTLRLERSKKLLNQLKSRASSSVKIISDEKRFSVDCVIYRRNDRFIVQKVDSASPVSYTKHPQSVMMLEIIASNGEKCLTIYIKEKEKVISDVNISLLKCYVVP